MEFDEKEILQRIRDHTEFVRRAADGRAYYANDNSIRRRGLLKDERGPLARTADNRISHNWHELLVNQKAAYFMTYPPLLDTGSAELNRAVMEAFGEKFPKVCKDLCVDASNTAVGWVHYWIDETGAFAYAAAPPEQVVPVYADTLEQRLENVIRIYRQEKRTVVEFWSAQRFIRGILEGGSIKECERVSHALGAVPFIPFYNNALRRGDLHMYRDLIDQYDKVVSGYCNDIEDMQEIIYVIKNYGGTDLGEFLKDLKRYKAVKVNEEAGGGGVETLQIDIPVEARTRLLDILRRQIFVSGQGVDPGSEQLGNSSGVALKYLYSLLELKAGLAETEFRLGFAALARAALRYLGQGAEKIQVRQVYTRNRISNDLETAQIAAQSAGLVSRRTILANHPWVDDVENEIGLLDKEGATGEKSEKKNDRPPQQ